MLIFGAVDKKSRPAWARGLKPCYIPDVAPQGYVASRMGAWIETHYEARFVSYIMSRSAWARGLKQRLAI